MQLFAIQVGKEHMTSTGAWGGNCMLLDAINPLNKCTADHKSEYNWLPYKPCGVECCRLSARRSLTQPSVESVLTSASTWRQDSPTLNLPHRMLACALLPLLGMFCISHMFYCWCSTDNSFSYTPCSVHALIFNWCMLCQAMFGPMIGKPCTSWAV